MLVDADVDAANLELVLQPRLLEEQDFKGGQVAVIDQDTCAACGDCVAVCRFDAILPHPQSGAPVPSPKGEGCIPLSLGEWGRG
jgi:MinD superfamily P-loop ATPase